MFARKKLLFAATIGAILAFTGIIGWIQTGTIVFVIMHLVGIALLLESVLLAYQIKPTPSNAYKHILQTIKLIILGAVAGVFFFDIANFFIFHFYDYPIFSPITNLWGYIGVSILWGLYFLIFHQSYTLLYHLLHRRHHHILLSAKRKELLSFIGPTGIVLILIGAAFPRLIDSPLLSELMVIIGAWFILEGFEWPRKRRTFLLDLLSGNIRPLIAIVASALLVGFLSEFANIVSPVQQWVYYNVPWENIMILKVPISLLLAWSFMYIIFLSLENILIKTEVTI